MESNANDKFSILWSTLYNIKRLLGSQEDEKELDTSLKLSLEAAIALAEEIHNELEDAGRNTDSFRASILLSTVMDSKRIARGYSNRMFELSIEMALGLTNELRDLSMKSSEEPCRGAQSRAPMVVIHSPEEEDREEEEEEAER
jgi:hypothetical protein